MKTIDKRLVTMPGNKIKRYVHVKELEDGATKAHWNGPSDMGDPKSPRKLYAGTVDDDTFFFDDLRAEIEFLAKYKPQRNVYRNRSLDAINERSRMLGSSKSNGVAGERVREVMRNKEYPFDQ